MKRTPEQGEPMRLPHVDEARNRVEIDPSWGTIQPHTLHPEVETVGELEVIAHIEAGAPLVDTRKAHYLDEGGTIAGAVAIEWEEFPDRIDELSRERPTVFFCNGPQCAATPHAVERLLSAGFPPGLIKYYRGGIHDWVTLGLPVTRP